MKKMTITIISALLLTITSFGQTDWNSVDMSEELKGKFKINNASAKSLKKNKTFINDFTISQATKMKGSERTATKSVFSEVTLSGLETDAYQEMVNQMYKSMITELEKAGLQITNGDDVIQSDYAQKRIEKDSNNEAIGNIESNTVTEGKKKVTEGMMPGYPAIAVTSDVSVRPENKIVYQTSSILKAGNFYQKLATKEDFNLLNIHFFVSFANFDGGRGYKDVKLETEPVMAVDVQITLITPKGGSQIYYKKDAWGTGNWSKGIGKVKDNESTADWLGLARSADFVIDANQEEFLNELKQILNAYQRDIAAGIKEEL